MAEFKFSTKILEEQGIEAKVGNHIKVKLIDEILMEGKIIEIKKGEVTVEGSAKE